MVKPNDHCPHGADWLDGCQQCVPARSPPLFGVHGDQDGDSITYWPDPRYGNAVASTARQLGDALRRLADK